VEVEVKYYAMLREATGKRREVVDIPVKSSVGDLVGLLSERYGGDFTRYVYDDGSGFVTTFPSCSTA